jgi:hypothetical protein
MQAPLIDTRTQADIVAQATQLAGQVSRWQPSPDGQADVGQALIGILGRFAGLVIERLNRAPDKNYLAFLNLIGASPVRPTSRSPSSPATSRRRTSSTWPSTRSSPSRAARMWCSPWSRLTVGSG